MPLRCPPLTLIACPVNPRRLGGLHRNTVNASDVVGAVGHTELGLAALLERRVWR